MRLQAAVDEQGTFKEKQAMRSQITASSLLGRFDAGLPEPVKGVGCDEVDGRCRSEEEEQAAQTTLPWILLGWHGGHSLTSLGSGR